jgi:Rod binding domain-containing protein
MDEITRAIPPLARPPLDPAATPGRTPARATEDRLRAEAERFEAAFLAEMLRHAGLGRMPETFNGGAGEAAFAGSLIQEYANRIAAAGGLGLADKVYQTLAGRQAG